jgi:DNA/RNA-binding domain of Phe-tRNA-synthetase-like protein
MKITLSENILNCLDKIRLALICFRSDVAASDKLFWVEMNQLLLKVQQQYQLDSVSKNLSIAKTREAYKKCGKDPNRYRPSADSLIRRVVKERGLYKVNTVVDVLNYVSIHSGISIGGYDMNKIIGNAKLDIGLSSDSYTGIGRGQLNITGMPVLRDEVSVFGSPTSDSERTMITKSTQKIAFVFFDFGIRNELQNDIQHTKILLEKYANASDFEESIIELD